MNNNNNNKDSSTSCKELDGMDYSVHQFLVFNESWMNFMKFKVVNEVILPGTYHGGEPLSGHP
jgi:hypothetical protein